MATENQRGTGCQMMAAFNAPGFQSSGRTEPETSTRKTAPRGAVFSLNLEGRGTVNRAPKGQ